MSPPSHSKMSPFFLRGDCGRGAGGHESQGSGSADGHSAGGTAATRAAGDGIPAVGVSIRQIKRLVQRWQVDGPSGLGSRRRGQRPNNAFSQAMRQEILNLVGDPYADFGSTLAVAPQNAVDAHRPIRHDDQELDQILCNTPAPSPGISASGSTAPDTAAGAVAEAIACAALASPSARPSMAT